MSEQTEPSTADIETGIKAELATIRKWWPHTFDPPKSGGAGSRDTPASRFPGNDTAISLRAEVVHDLAFWVHALLDDHPDAIDDWGTIDALDVPRTCRFLTDQAADIARWEHGNRMWDELTTLAREVRNLASPPRRDTMAIGGCPECGKVVRVKPDKPGDIKCKGCGITDTIDGWTLRIVGHHELVTIPQLVPILHKRMGIVVSERTLRRWYEDGKFAAKTDGATPKFDRRDVFAALAYLEHQRSVG